MRILRQLPTILALFLSLLLSACGYHLQYDLPLAEPLHRLYLQSADPYGNLARYLKEALKLSQVCLVSDPDQAAAVLVILHDNGIQTLLSVNSTTQTRQYLLQVIVVFAINDANGCAILPPQRVAESRVITVQSNQILGSSNEANLYYQQMRRSLVSIIMNRIASREVTELVNQHYALR